MTDSASKRLRRDNPHLVNPDKTERWFKTLPLTNLDALGSRLLDAVLTVVDLRLPPKRQLAVLERLESQIRRVLEHYGRYYRNISYPLTPRARQVVEANEALLQATANAYEATARALDGSGYRRFGPKGALKTALGRSLIYRGEYLLSTVQIYSHHAPGLWESVATAYTRAVRWGLLDDSIASPNYRYVRSATLKTLCKRIWLFYMLNPHGLNQTQNQRLYESLEVFANYVELCDHPTADGRQAIAAPLMGDQPPKLLEVTGGGDFTGIAFLDIAQLYALVRGSVAPNPKDKQAVAILEDASLQELAEQTLSRLDRATQRRFERVGGEGAVWVSVGIVDINRGLQSPLPSRAEPRSERRQPAAEEPSNADRLELRSYSDLWGERILDQENRRRKALADEGAKAAKPSDPWALVNVSEGGCALRWGGGQATRARVGEVVAIHGLTDETAEWDAQWWVGVIRRLQAAETGSLDIGVEFIAKRCRPLTSHREGEAFYYEGLYLLGGSEMGDLLAFPVQLYDEGERIFVSYRGASGLVTLTTPRERTQFVDFFPFTPGTDGL